MAEFSGKVAIVSGGARGIGRAAARKLAGEGASVVICSDREEQVEETVAALREEGLEVRGVRADVTSSADMKKLMDLAIETYGGVDVLVNSAGVQRYGTVVETEEEVWDEVLDVNLKGIYLASRYAIPEMRKRGGGAIAPCRPSPRRRVWRPTRPAKGASMLSPVRWPWITRGIISG
jgi:NAD(P)-dependent dehydrogenase (short-subunit alcohol dehydrogenase family)